ncbi:MAG: hypothetical protein RMN25_11970 [Anaerolineae bacterium]|nr:hypothetical protein [Thermoflexales bacterium]MDW8408487.1 hypothetical protein [Anaerolineae bacterium]
MNILWRRDGAKAAQRVLLCGAFVFAFYQVVEGLASAPLHVDEFVYIHHSNWLNELWLGTGSLYQVSGDTLRDPPVTPYLIGLSLRAGGYPDAPTYWLSPTPEGWPLLGASLPEGPRLWLIRFPMAASLFLTIVLTAALVTRTAGFWAGLLAVAALASSEYLLVHVRRAMTEAPMLFFISALIVASAWGRRVLRAGSLVRAIPIAGLLGGLVGLGAASKHNAAVNLAGLWALIVATQIGSASGFRHNTTRALALGFIATVGALGVFVVLTPILHTDTVRRIQMMLAERQTLIVRQQQAGNDGLTTVGQRIEASARRTFNHYMPLNCSLNRGERIFWDVAQRAYRSQAGGTPSPLVGSGLCASLFGQLTPIALANAALAVLGGWRIWCARRQPEASAFLFYGAVNVTLAVLLIPLDWDRYYLLPVFFATTLTAIGVAQAGDSIQTLIRWVQNRVRQR